MSAVAAAPAAPAPLEPTWEELLGPTLIKDPEGKQTIKTADALKDKDLVLLYFSAAWCPPCQAFSPLLKRFYQDVAAKSALEIIYISSDNSVPEFQKYFSTMPWLSLPTSQGSAALKNNLASSLQITGIPALVVLTKSNVRFVTNQGREQVTRAMQSGNNAEAALNLIQGWKAAESVPLSQAKTANKAGPGGVWGIVLTILKNPAAMFAMFYLFKWIIRQYKQLNAASGGDDGAAAAAVIAEDEEVIPEPQASQQEYEF